MRDFEHNRADRIKNLNYRINSKGNKQKILGNDGSHVDRALITSGQLKQNALNDRYHNNKGGWGYIWSKKNQRNDEIVRTMEKQVNKELEERKRREMSDKLAKYFGSKWPANKGE